MILIRVYGHNSELMIDRQSEIRNMTLLHANDCGSELYASFQNGLAYQFLPGSILTMDTVLDPLIFPFISNVHTSMLLPFAGLYVFIPDIVGRERQNLFVRLFEDE